MWGTRGFEGLIKMQIGVSCSFVVVFVLCVGRGFTECNKWVAQDLTRLVSLV